MLSNGAAHLQNNVFVAVAGDDEDHAFLYASSAPEAPIALLTLNRRIQFDLSVDGVQQKKRACEDTTAGRAQGVEGKPVAETSMDGSLHSQIVTPSPDGELILVWSPMGRRHVVLETQIGEVSEFRVDRPTVSVAWHPDRDTHVVFMLSDHGVIQAMEMTLTSKPRAPSPANGIVLTRAIPKCVSSISITLVWEALYHRRSDGVCSSTVVQSVAADALERRLLPSSLSASSISTGGSGSDEALPSADDKKKAAHCKAEAEAAAQRLQCIQIATVAATAGLPNMLLLLFSRGDVVSVKIGQDYGLTVDAATAALLQDKPPVTQSTTAAHLLCVHHVVETPKDYTGAVHSVVAISMEVVPRDMGSGVFTIAVLYTDGNLRCFDVTEKEILSLDARHATSSCSVALTTSPLETAVVRVSSSVSMPAVLPTKTNSTVSSSLTSKKQTAATGLQLSPTWEWLKNTAGLHMLARNGNLLLVKINGSKTLFLVAFPVWHYESSQWVYLTEERQGHERISVISRDRTEMPPPLATRIPLRIEGYSVAINDAGEILLFPTLLQSSSSSSSSSSKPPPLDVDAAAAPSDDADKQQKGVAKKGVETHALPAISVQASEFLECSLRATIKNVAYLSRTTGTAARRVSESSQPTSISVLGSASSSLPAPAPVSSSHSAEVKNLCDTVISDLNRCSAALITQKISGKKKAASDSAPSKSTLEALQSSYIAIKSDDASVNDRQAKLANRLALLNERANGLVSRSFQMREQLQDAVYSRNGVESIHQVNRTLGAVHTMLNEIELNLGQLEEDAAAKRRNRAKEDIE